MTGFSQHEGLGEAGSASRLASSKQRTWLLPVTGLLALFVVAGLVFGFYRIPDFRARILLFLVSEDEVELRHGGSSAYGEALALVEMGEAALPVLLPAAAQEAREGRSARVRSLVLLTVERLAPRHKPRSKRPLKRGDITVTTTPAEAYRGLAICLRSPAHPALRIKALELLRSYGDARCLRLLIGHLRALLDDGQAWLFSAPRGQGTRAGELRRTFSVLAGLARVNPGLVYRPSDQSWSGTPYQDPWPMVFCELAGAPPGSGSIGYLQLRGRRRSVEGLVEDLEAWMSSKAAVLPRQARALDAPLEIDRESRPGR